MKIFQSDFFQDDSQVYPSIQTSTTLTQPPSEELTSSQADSRANRSVLPGSKEARRITVGSGRKCSELLSKHNPLGSLLKTLLVSSTWHSTRCYLTWKPKTTPRQRLYFQLAVKMPSTSAKDAGSLPNVWPTPSANQFECKDLDKMLQRRARAKESSGNGNGFGLTLANAARMWPTPTVNEDAAGTPNGKMQRMLGNHPQVRNTGQGSLNPDWVEALMGYPKGWTSLDDGETDLGKTESLE